MIAKTAIIYSNVKLGNNVTIEDYCIIGCPSRGENASSPEETIIGDDAHIRSHTVIYSGNKIGNKFQTGNKVNIREKNIIGNNVSVGTLSVIEHHVDISDNVRIHTQAFIPEYSKLEEDCWIGPNVVLTNASYPKSPEAKYNLRGPIIKKQAKVGANSTILPGIVVGENSLVGAGSTVVKDVEAGSVVVGNPSKKINTVDNLPYGK